MKCIARRAPLAKGFFYFSIISIIDVLVGTTIAVFTSSYIWAFMYVVILPLSFMTYKTYKTSSLPEEVVFVDEDKKEVKFCVSDTESYKFKIKDLKKVEIKIRHARRGYVSILHVVTKTGFELSIEGIENDSEVLDYLTKVKED